MSPFDEAIALQPDGEGRFLGRTHPGYANMVGPFGGVMAAQALQAVLADPRCQGEPISTSSRIAGGVSTSAPTPALTEFGTYRLKFFFSESLSTESGEEVSTREVKKILSDLVESEPKKKPLSDERLTELLQEKGYNIARRTVAKYREQLNIPVARLRKSL